MTILRQMLLASSAIPRAAETGAGSGGDDGNNKGGGDDKNGKGGDKAGEPGDKTDQGGGDGKDGKGGGDGDGKGGDGKGGPKKKSATLIGDDDDDGGGDAVEFAPEKYEPFKLSDDEVLDDDSMAAFEPIARKLNGGKGLSQADAQSLIDFQIEQNKKDADKRAEDWAQWEKDARADKEIGGTAFDENVRYLRAAVADPAKGGVGSKALRNLLNVSGLGNHPEIVRLGARIGKMLAEGKTNKPAGGDGDGDEQEPGDKGGDKSEQSRLDAMYPSTAKK